MRFPRTAIAPLVTALVLSSGASAALALANAPGGAQAPTAATAPLGTQGGAQAPTAATAPLDAPGGVQVPSAPQAGGSQYGFHARMAERPVVSELSVPRTATAGSPPRVIVRIDEAGVGTVKAQLSVIDLSTHEPVITVALGWIPTARALNVSWPRGATLTPGSYQVSLSAHDHHNGTLLPGAHSSREASLTVKAPVQAPPPAPAPPAAPLEAGVLTPAQTASAGAVFPVAGPHNFGGPENRFGAPRDGYVHEGQDVLTVEGTPVVLPMAGTILTTSYQASGAGYYAVEHTNVGFDFMFAHCEAGSLVVNTGQAVSAGQALCEAGQTGDATAPHLHFEMWVGGWQAPTGHPIDPLPYLEAWDHAGAAS
ncbi:MAG: M23 family metallopeptidase [Solirubrobacteraceae bacterium]|jgi:biotin carboxyl carrier protein